MGLFDKIVEAGQAIVETSGGRRLFVGLVLGVAIIFLFFENNMLPGEYAGGVAVNLGVGTGAAIKR